MKFKRKLFLLSVALVAIVAAGVLTSRAEQTDYVLALSWQPAFCEFLDRKKECKTQTRDRYDASNFSLHGLWPQPRSNAYCGVKEEVRRRDKQGKWRSLPFPRLPRDVWDDLTRVMPGTVSGLQRHEWIKHGTCYSPGDNKEYFADSIWLVEQVNQSAVGKLFSGSIGKNLDTRAIRNAFDDAFGDGVGERVRVSCKRDGKRQIINEITIGLSGEISPQSDFGKLALAAASTKPGCPGGIVDDVGNQ